MLNFATYAEIITSAHLNLSLGESVDSETAAVRDKTLL
jgi:hypothetical protein